MQAQQIPHLSANVHRGHHVAYSAQGAFQSKPRVAPGKTTKKTTIYQVVALVLLTMFTLLGHSRYEVKRLKQLHAIASNSDPAILHHKKV